MEPPPTTLLLGSVKILVTLQHRTAAQQAGWHRCLVSLSAGAGHILKREKKWLCCLINSFYFRFKFLPCLESRREVRFSPPLKKTNNTVSLKYFLLVIFKYFISVSVFILKKNTQETETALFKLCKWDVSDNFKSFLMHAHAELRDLSSLTLFCKQFQ